MWPYLFQSTLLMRGATHIATGDEGMAKFQSTLLMRGATEPPKPDDQAEKISIHAPLARSDLIDAINLRVKSISIHAPHARSDALLSPSSASGRFQSTLLMRGATNFIRRAFSLRCYFNPRSSCEERRPAGPYHADLRHFNPRSSCEERRGAGPKTSRAPQISIHAPHARSDSY